MIQPRMHTHAGADVSECDVCWTKELIPICRHEPYLSATTDAMTKFPQMASTDLYRRISSLLAPPAVCLFLLVVGNSTSVEAGLSCLASQDRF